MAIVIYQLQNTTRKFSYKIKRKEKEVTRPKETIQSEKKNNITNCVIFRSFVFSLTTNVFFEK